MGAAKNPAWGKLGPNWEGPYRITSEAGIGAYFLEDLDEHVICNTTSLECKQPKEVLLLINIFMVSLFILYMKCLYFLPFNSLKCLNLNSIITGVLRLDNLG